VETARTRKIASEIRKPVSTVRIAEARIDANARTAVYVAGLAAVTLLLAAVAAVEEQRLRDS